MKVCDKCGKPLLAKDSYTGSVIVRNWSESLTREYDLCKNCLSRTGQVIEKYLADEKTTN